MQTRKERPMKPYLSLPLVTSALAGLRALPPVVSASARKKKEGLEGHHHDADD
jgi:hypothetical protein